MYRLIKDFLGLLILSFLLYSPAFAANITITPAIVERNVSPGSSYNFTINITNNDSVATEPLYATVNNIKNVTDTGQPIFTDDMREKTGFEMASWVSISSEALKIASGETRVIPFAIAVPGDATPGWHAAAIFIGNKPLVSAENNTSAVDYRTAIIISFRVAGAVSDELQINKFSTRGYIFTNPNIDFEVVLENTGNALQRPAGNIEITDFNGQMIANIDINEKRSAVIPGNLRTLRASWTGDKWSFGKYKAALALSYGVENAYKTTARQTYFWVLPGKFLITVGGIVLVVALSVYLFVRIYVRKRLGEVNVVVPVKSAGRVSKLMMMTLASLVFSVIFLLILFILFS